MLKQKIKLSLIEDYIKIASISSFCANYSQCCAIEDKTNLIWVTTLAKELQASYDKLLFKYNFMDVSLLALKKELKQAEEELKHCKKECLIYNKTNLLKYSKEIKGLYNNLLEKLNKLALNEIEQRYIMQSLSKAINSPVCVYM